MADNRSARIRLLALVDILKVYSNEANVLSVDEICEHLERYGFTVTKRAVLSDIKTLNTTPYKVIYVTKPKKGYYIIRNFTLAAVDSLMTAVHSSEMLSSVERKTAEEAMKKILSIPTHDLLMSTTERVAVEVTHEPASWDILMALRTAIAQKKKVQISYTVTCPGDSFTSAEKEETMSVNPVKIAISSHTMLFVFTQTGIIGAKCMHLCRIKSVKILDEDTEEFTGNIADAVGFFTGSIIRERHMITRWVFLRIKHENIELVRNFFDSPIQFRKDDEEGYYIAKVFTLLDERFIGWLFCYGDKVEIIAPQGLKDFVLDRLKNNITSV